MLKIIIIDHQDSFTFNLFQLFSQTNVEVKVIENTQGCAKFVEKEKPDALIFSPGPGSVLNPSDMGESFKIFKKYQGKIPILGVCLGHQLIGHMLGGEIIFTQPAHGQKETINILHHDGLFKGLPATLSAMRYHSQCIKSSSLPNSWITAASEDKTLMALEIPEKKLYGVQFHPESIGTPDGKKIAKNFIELLKGEKRRGGSI